MKRDLPAYVVRLKGKGGKLYLTFKRRGWPTQRFENQEIGSAFFAEYARILNGTAPAPAANSIKGLVTAYYRSAKFAQLAKRSKDDYTGFLTRLERNSGNTDVTRVRRQHVIAWRDQLAKAKSPHYANYFIRVLRVLFEYAIDIGRLTENPAKGVSELRYEKSKPEPWPKDKIEAARTALPYEHRTRLLFELLYCTGQRVGDVLAMKWSDIRGDGISVSQSKTGAELVIPITDELRECLRRAERDGETILTAYRKTTPWAYRGAADAMMKLRKSIGAEAYTIHAIRHTVASEIGAAGSDDEVMAITGHTTSGMVRHYAGAARQKARAEKAQKRRK